MTVLFQGIEAAKDILNVTDVTVVGISLAIIIVLLYALNKKDKQLTSLNEYIRKQNKENLEVLNNLSQSLGGVENKVDINIYKTDKVEDVLHNIRLDINSILTNGNK